ncbi:MAG: AraC family transcriptional regulator [Bacteroidia bacterium]
MSKNTNTFLLWKDMVLFWGTISKEIKLHEHPAIQLVFGINRPFLHKNPENQWIPKHGLLIGANQQHECDAHGQPIFSLKIDSESSLGESITQELTSSNPIITLPKLFSEYFDLAFMRRLIHAGEHSAIYEQIIRFFKSEMKVSLHFAEKDPRIQTVIDYLKEHYLESVPTEQLLEMAHLSESRFLHLFKEQVGIPVRNYIHWCRIQHAIKSIMNGMNLTEAAYESGFADSAHLSRIFTRMTGASPSLTMKNSRIVQVFVEE